MGHKVLSSVKTLLASVLLVAMLFTTQGMDNFLGWMCHSDYVHLSQVEAATTSADAGKYVGEMKIYEGDSASIRDQITKDGYLYVDQDMNEGAGGKYTYLAYKLTDNKKDAITDMHLLAQDTGYAILDYNAIVNQNYTALQPLAAQLHVACMEYARQFESGSPAAVFANTMLNLYMMVDSSGRKTPFGDYLADIDNLKVSDLFRIITRANTTIINTMYNYIAMGVADYPELEGKNVWFKLLSKQGMFAYEESEEDDVLLNEVGENVSEEERQATRAYLEHSYWQQMDARYRTDALNIKDALISYAEEATEALKHPEVTEIDPGDVDLYDLDSVLDNVKDACVDVQEDGKQSEEDRLKSYASFFVANDGFNQYKFECPVYGTHYLGDYLIALGNDLAKGAEDAIRNAYPLVDVLSEGQYTMLRTVGVLSLLNSLVNTDEGMEVGYEQYDMIVDALAEEGVRGPMSIWESTAVDPYMEQVAQTSDDARQTRAGLNIDWDTRTDIQKLDAKIANVMKWVELGSSCVSLVFLTSTLVTCIVKHSMVSLMTVSLTALSAYWQVHAFWGTFFSLMGVGIAALNYIGLFITLVYLLYTFVKFLVEIFYEPEPEYNKEKMPRVMYDVVEGNDGGMGNVLYKAVYNQYGEVGDINGFSQSQWDALYYSNDPKIGSPIVADDMGQVFKIVKSSDMSLQQPGYHPLTLFGQESVTDLNLDAKKSNQQLYMFYRTQASIEREQENPDPSPEEEDPTNTDATYLSDLFVFYCDKDNEGNYLNTAKKNGFSILQKNLSPYKFDVAGGWYENYYCTYICYKTTKNPDNAIRDIRVAPYVVTSQYYYGSSSYTLAGMTSNKEGKEEMFGGYLSSATGVYYSKKPSESPPILADFKVSNTKLDWDNEEGWEPISCFSNGNPFDFRQDGFYNTEYNALSVMVDFPYCPNSRENELPFAPGHQTYVYFRKAHNYNKDVNRKKYIAGYSFVGGCTVDVASPDNLDKIHEETLQDYMDFIGTNAFDYDLSEVKQGQKAAGQQYLTYNYTYDPYRAIYDIQIYEAGKLGDLPGLVVKQGKIGYSPCEVYLQYDLWDYGTKIRDTDWAEFMNSVRAISPSHAFFGRFGAGGNLKGQGNGEGMYVSGYQEGKQALTEDDIYFSLDDAKPKDGYVGVHMMGHPYDTQAYNLRGTRSSDYPLYMFMRGEAPTRGKYISKISVSSGNINDALTGAYSAYVDGELIPINIADDGNMHVTPQNISFLKEDANYIEGRAAFMSVEYTNDMSKALTSIVRVNSTLDAKKMPAEFTFDNKTFKKASQKIESSSGSWYMYTATSSSEAPIVSFSFTNEIFEDGYYTAPILSYTEATGEGTTATPASYAYAAKGSESFFLHMKKADGWETFDNLYLAANGDYRKAQAELLNQGCDGIVNYNLNTNVGGDTIYLGYSHSKNAKNTSKICDMVLTKGVPYSTDYNKTAKKNYIKIGSKVYYSAGEVNLNQGTAGSEIYLYYYGTTLTSTKNSPYVSLYVGLGDSIPVTFTPEYLEKQDKAREAAGEKSTFTEQNITNLDPISSTDVKYLYERILDSNNELCDLNSGLYSTRNGADIESRIYLYGAHANNSVKDSPYAQTFERNGSDITLLGTYGLYDRFYDYSLIQ